MELEDIVLQQGDMVYFTDETWHIDSKENGRNFYDIFENDSDIALIKIERPIKYETIYEASEEMLDKGKKDILKREITSYMSIHNYKIAAEHNDGTLVYEKENLYCFVTHWGQKGTTCFELKYISSDGFTLTSNKTGGLFNETYFNEQEKYLQNLIDRMVK